MTIQEELAQARIQKHYKEMYFLFEKLNNICLEEADMNIYSVLINYDIATNDAFSTLFNAFKESIKE